MLIDVKETHQHFSEQALKAQKLSIAKLDH